MSSYIYTTISGPDGDDTNGQISAINDSGTVVAFFGNGTVSGEYIYSNGVYTTLTSPDGAVLDPAGINDLGEVVGQYVPTNSSEGFIYQDGTFTTLTVKDRKPVETLKARDTRD